MKCHSIISFLPFFTLFNILRNVSCNEIYKKPTVLIGIIARNKAHTLPYTLSFLEKLDYPKHRIALWIQSDNNVDNTIEVLNKWITDQGNNYFSINTTLDEVSHGIEDENSIFDWTSTRFEHIIKLREEVLNYARKIWADYVFMLDADAFLTNPNSLELLISKNKTVVAPLLKSEGLYSNFWAGMSDDYYYKRTEEYEPILTGQKTGCFKVPMVHSAVLIDLRRQNSDFLTYDSKKLHSYNGPRDDIITFALSASNFDIPLHICNNESYGYITVPLEKRDSIEQDYQQLANLKLEILSTADLKYLQVSKAMKKFIRFPKKDTLGLSNVYMINLVRRPERRQRMLACFDELGLNAELVDAVDGRTINEGVLDEWNIKMMPGYKDPYHKRPMTMGEVGCFLSHFIVWNRIVQDGHEYALVLEDDVKFETYFRRKITLILQELEKREKDWDLVYLGRKRMKSDQEKWVPGSQYLVYADYSYWTVGYLLSAKGAQKLIDAKPLENLVPVDEYLPIMYGKHPRDDWRAFFEDEDRNFIALSAEPLILFPTHYTGETGYISDTENSVLLPEDVSNEKNGREEL